MNWELTSGEASESFFDTGRGRLFIMFCVIAAWMMIYSQPATAQMQFEWVKNYPNFQVHSATIFCEGYYSNTDAIKIIFITVLGIQNFNKLILSNKLI